MLAVLLQGDINRCLIQGFSSPVCSPRESERELNKFLNFDYFPPTHIIRLLQARQFSNHRPYIIVYGKQFKQTYTVEQTEIPMYLNSRNRLTKDFYF